LGHIPGKSAISAFLGGEGTKGRANVMAKKIRVVPQGKKKNLFFTFIFPHQFYLAGFAEQSAFAEESPTKLSATQVTKRAN